MMNLYLNVRYYLVLEIKFNVLYMLEEFIIIVIFLVWVFILEIVFDCLYGIYREIVWILQIQNYRF